METKICSKCKIEKNIVEFSVRLKSKDGLRSTCKLCDKEETKKWRLNNKEKVKLQKKRYLKKNHNKNLKRGKIYRNNNKEKVKIRSTNWRKNNSEYQKNYYNKNKKELNEKIKLKKKTDPIFKLKTLYRSKLNKILGNKTQKTFDLIGCTPQVLKEHIENQFKDGMSWNNHSQFGWHIDHIIPISSAKNKKDLVKLCHYTNLQPLWWRDNLQKGNKI